MTAHYIPSKGACFHVTQSKTNQSSVSSGTILNVVNEFCHIMM